MQYVSKEGIRRRGERLCIGGIMNVELLDIICKVYVSTGNNFIYVVDRISDMVYHVSRSEANRIFQDILENLSSDIAAFLLDATDEERKLALIDTSDITDGDKLKYQKGILPSVFLSN